MKPTIHSLITRLWAAFTGRPALQPVRMMSRSQMVMMRIKQRAMERNRF